MITNLLFDKEKVPSRYKNQLYPPKNLQEAYKEAVKDREQFLAEIRARAAVPQPQQIEEAIKTAVETAISSSLLDSNAVFSLNLKL